MLPLPLFLVQSPITADPPVPNAALTELAWFGESDPMLMDLFRWLLARLPSLQKVVIELVKAEPKALFRLMPDFEVRYGRMTLAKTATHYEITLLVPVLPWTRAHDALEPWVASTVFLALGAARRGGVRGTRDPQTYRWDPQAEQQAFAFQAQVRAELRSLDPSRYGDLPDGQKLYQKGFPTLQQPRRPLGGVPK